MRTRCKTSSLNHRDEDITTLAWFYTRRRRVAPLWLWF